MSNAVVAVVEIHGVVGEVIGITISEVDMGRVSANIDRARRGRGIATRGIEARSVGLHETATSPETGQVAAEDQGVAVPPHAHLPRYLLLHDLHLEVGARSANEG